MKLFEKVFRESTPPRAVCQDMIRAINGDPEDMDLQYEVWEFMGDIKNDVDDIVARSDYGHTGRLEAVGNEPCITLKKFLWKHKANAGPVLDVFKKYYKHTSFYLELLIQQGGWRTIHDDEAKDYPKHPKSGIREAWTAQEVWKRKGYELTPEEKEFYKKHINREDTDNEEDYDYDPESTDWRNFNVKSKAFGAMKRNCKVCGKPIMNHDDEVIKYGRVWHKDCLKKINESTYKDEKGWNTHNLTRWWKGGGPEWKPAGKKAEDMKELIEKNFKDLYRQNKNSFDNIVERFYMIDDNDEVKFKVMLVEKELYELYVDSTDKYGNNKDLILEWKTDDAEHAGAMMEYLFGDL